MDSNKERVHLDMNALATLIFHAVKSGTETVIEDKILNKPSSTDLTTLVED